MCLLVFVHCFFLLGGGFRGFVFVSPMHAPTKLTMHQRNSIAKNAETMTTKNIIFSLLRIVPFYLFLLIVFFRFSVFPLFDCVDFVAPKTPELNRMQGVGGFNCHTQEWWNVPSKQQMQHHLSFITCTINAANAYHFEQTWKTMQEMQDKRRQESYPTGSVTWALTTSSCSNIRHFRIQDPISSRAKKNLDPPPWLGAATPSRLRSCGPERLGWGWLGDRLDRLDDESSRSATTQLFQPSDWIKRQP